MNFPKHSNRKPTHSKETKEMAWRGIYVLLPTRRLESKDHLSLLVQDQPGKHTEAMQYIYIIMKYNVVYYIIIWEEIYNKYILFIYLYVKILSFYIFILFYYTQ